MKEMTARAAYMVRKAQELEQRRVTTANVVLGYLLAFHREKGNEEDQ
jgi:hypothetical protein